MKVLSSIHNKGSLSLIHDEGILSPIHNEGSLSPIHNEGVCLQLMMKEFWIGDKPKDKPFGSAPFLLCTSVLTHPLGMIISRLS